MLPTELQLALGSGRAALAAHPWGGLVLPHRQRIWAAMGPRIRKPSGGLVPSAGWERRTTLAVLTARRVLPVWERVADDDRPHQMLRLIDDFRNKRIPKQALTNEIHMLDGGIQRAEQLRLGKPAVYVALATIAAACCACSDEKFDPTSIDPSITEKRFYEEWDTAYRASIAASGNHLNSRMTYLMWAQRSTFWGWYLYEAVPLAYLTHPDV